MEEIKREDIVPPDIGYPKFLTLWDTDIPKESRLRIINEGDFPKEAILKGLGIGNSPLTDSFGITDEDEIKHRIDLIQFFVANPEIMDYIRETEEEPLRLPLFETEFLQYFNPQKIHNPYWEKVINFIDMVNSAKNVPARIQEFVKTLTEVLRLEETENKMAKIMADRIQNITIVEGLVSFLVKEVRVVQEPEGISAVSLELIKSYAHGHQMFSYAVDTVVDEPYPKWTKQKVNPLNWIGIGKLARLIVDKKNAFHKKQAFEEMVITEASPEIIGDIREAIEKKLLAVKPISQNLDDTILHIYFAYSKKGLRLRIYSVDCNFSSEQNFEFDEFRGYNQERLKVIEEARKDYEKIATDNCRSLMLAKARVGLEEKYSFLFGNDPFEAISPRMDSKHKWFAVINLYKSGLLNQVYEASVISRKFFISHINKLDNVVDLAMKLGEKAKELKTNLSFPQILDGDEHLVSFKEIFPIHLLPGLKGNGLVPISSLPDINGQMIALSGKHGGGKTVTGLTLMDNIYLAQSGLPVFGRGFKLNVKDMLGLMFIERGSGSTCQTLLKKIKNILEELKKTKPSKGFVILDEVGTGTQELDGYELGKDLLTKLNDLGISVIFSSQITSLVEFSRSKLGAGCFQVDENHRITPGI